MPTVVSFPEKGLLVLSYLLSMQRESERRTTLARILWGGAGRDVAQVNLRKAISRIRSRQNQLEVEFLGFTEGMVSSGRTPITSDLLSLQGGEPVARLRRLVALFDQPYLGPVRCQSPDFDRWLVQRQNTHSDLLKALLKEAAASARGPEGDEVIKSAAILIFRTSRRIRIRCGCSYNCSTRKRRCNISGHTLSNGRNCFPELLMPPVPLSIGRLLRRRR
jgi:hypothetical protein